MSGRLYRCYRCTNRRGELGFDFGSDSETPVCPSCGGGGFQDEGGCLERLVVIHFQPPVPSNNPRVALSRGKDEVACTPNQPAIGTGVRMSTEPRAVTCWDCMQTDVFQGTKRARAFDPAYDKPRPVPEIGVDRNPDGTLPGQFRAEPVQERNENG